MRCLLGLVLLATPVLAEPVDNCASLLGSLSVELRVARSLSSSSRTTFVCPRDTSALLGASRQRILNSLGSPDATRDSGNDGGNLWTYYFSASVPGATPIAGTPELSFEFDGQYRVSTVTCQRIR